MKTGPLRPARIEWADDGTPWAPEFGDVYHARIGADVQARHVFLAGNGLPARWAGRDDFCIAETGFGLGHNFLATWAAWRADSQRPRRLHYVAIDAHPPRPADLRRAHAASGHPALAAALHAAWPPLTPGLHRIDFDDGALQLLLAWGDIGALLPQLRFGADAFYLDGFAPDRNPDMWQRRVLQALGRRARPGATAATWSVARELRDGLTTAGFVWQRAPGMAGKREVLQARFAPRGPALADLLPPAAGARQAVVVGAGLAGACAAAALARQGFAVTVLDRAEQPASADSGGGSANPGGLFHPTVHASDGAHARWLRAGALHTARWLAQADPAAVPRGDAGLLRLETQRPLTAMRAVIAAQGWPADHVQALSAAEAGALAGVPLPAPAWFYPGAGWASPAALVRWALARPGIRFLPHADVAALRRDGEHWQCLDAQGRCLAQAPQLVLAAAGQVNPLLVGLGHAALPLQRSRGQISGFDADALPLRLPVAGDGYALPLPNGLLCGATHVEGDDDPRVRTADHAHNFDRLRHLTGLHAPGDPSRWWGRVGWRVQTADRLPVAGPVPLWPLPPGTRADQARLLPRTPGLHLLCALGGRGLTLAPLLADVVAARIAGAPLPVEQALLDAVDPGRWLVRAARGGSRTHELGREPHPLR